MTPERKRTLQRAGVTSGFGLLVFVVAFYLSFPFDRIKDQVIATFAANNFDVEIAEAGPTFGLGMAFGDVRVKTRPTDGSKPTQVHIDSARVTLSLLAQLQGEAAYSLSADTLGGQVDVDWRGTQTTNEIHIAAEELAMASLPGVKEAINLPLGGTLGLTLDVTSPANRYAESKGTLRWECEACVIGDGKEKLKIAGNPLLSEGISLPRIRLGDFVGRIVIDKGVGKFQGVSAKSQDGELSIEGELRLADPLPGSYLDIYVRFRLSEALLKSADKIQLMLQLAESMGKRPDGYFGFRLSGTLSRLTSFEWAKTSPFVSTSPPVATRPTSGNRGSAPASGVRAPAAPASGPADPDLAAAAAAAPPSPVAPPSAGFMPSPPPTLPPNPAGLDPAAPTVDPLKDPNVNLPSYPSLPPSSIPEPVSPPPPTGVGGAPAGN